VNVELVTACGAVGLVVGAAAHVVIERVPRKERLLDPPFPELAASLRSSSGLGVTVLMAALFAGVAARIGAEAELPAFLVLTAALVVLSVIDLRHFLLPNRIVFPLTLVSAALFVIAAFVDDDFDALGRAGIGAVAAFAAFTALHLVSPRAMGFGDVKLSFVLGLDLAWLGSGEAVLGLVLGFVYGSVVGIVLLVTNVRTRKDHVPFGPFMAAGALTAVLAGPTLLDWYRG
jgi:leader peptidase (prepilin peptidase)/N-methyltransferase